MGTNQPTGNGGSFSKIRGSSRGVNSVEEGVRMWVHTALKTPVVISLVSSEW